MSSLFDVPAQLILVLSLAASTPASDTGVVAVQANTLSSQTPVLTQPLEGPFRFGEAIWLRALKETAPGDAARDFSSRIFKTSGGRYYVPAAAERREVLQARWDGAFSSRVARSFAESNARLMSSALHREITAGELYLAHLFGPEAAIGLIKLVNEKPSDTVAEHLPELAQAMADSLYARGAPLTLAEFYARLTGPLRAPPVAISNTMALGSGVSRARAELDFKPSFADVAPGGAASLAAVNRTSVLAWQTEVRTASSAAPPQ